MTIDRLQPTRSPKSKASSAPVLFLLALAASLALLEVTPAVAEDHDLTLYAFEQPHMGTLFRIKLYADSKQEAQVAATAAFNRIDDLNQKLSDYLPQSELNQLAASPANKPVKLSDDLFTVLNQALHTAHFFEGAFDPTIGYSINLWRRSVRKKILPTPQQLADAQARSGYKNLVLDPHSQTATLKIEGMFLDLGGIAKGFAADAAIAVLTEHGITRAAIAAGGDIRLGDPPPDSPQGWKIPVLGMDRDEESITTNVRLKNAAISTSGDREQFVEIDGAQYSHIVNPVTGLGLTRRITATVIAPNATTSDSYATTLCILGPNHHYTLPLDTHSLIITLDKEGKDHVYPSPKFPTP
jgi:thiamine biosynthesis lipoprotein